MHKTTIRERMLLRLAKNKEFYIQKTKENEESYLNYLSSNKKEDIDNFIYSKQSLTTKEQ